MFEFLLQVLCHCQSERANPPRPIQKQGFYITRAAEAARTLARTNHAVWIWLRQYVWRRHFSVLNTMLCSSVNTNQDRPEQSTHYEEHNVISVEYERIGISIKAHISELQNQISNKSSTSMQCVHYSVSFISHGNAHGHDNAETESYHERKEDALPSTPSRALQTVPRMKYHSDNQRPK